MLLGSKGMAGRCGGGVTHSTPAVGPGTGLHQPAGHGQAISSPADATAPLTARPPSTTAPASTAERSTVAFPRTVTASPRAAHGPTRAPASITLPGCTTHGPM